MGGGRLAVEYAEQLVGERAAFDAVDVEHGGMGGKARPDGRGGVVARPIDHLASASPNTARL